LPGSQGVAASFFRFSQRHPGLDIAGFFASVYRKMMALRFPFELKN